MIGRVVNGGNGSISRSVEAGYSNINCSFFRNKKVDEDYIRTLFTRFTTFNIEKSSSWFMVTVNPK